MPRSNCWSIGQIKLDGESTSLGMSIPSFLRKGYMTMAKPPSKPPSKPFGQPPKAAPKAPPKMPPSPITSKKIKSLAGHAAGGGTLTPHEQRELGASVLAHIEPRKKTPH